MNLTNAICTSFFREFRDEEVGSLAQGSEGFDDKGEEVGTLGNGALEIESVFLLLSGEGSAQRSMGLLDV